jgi:Excreted virulence factor EspC, type VII ESX diderm
MGQHDATRVDIGAVLAAAGRCDDVATRVDDAVRTHLTSLSFGAAAAGRSHLASGSDVRTAVDRLGDDMRTWARACVEVACCLRASADGYVSAVARGTSRLG